LRFACCLQSAFYLIARTIIYLYEQQRRLEVRDVSEFITAYPLAFRLLVKRRAEAINRSPQFVIAEARSALVSVRAEEGDLRKDIALEKKLAFGSPEVTKFLASSAAYRRLQLRKQALLDAVSKATLLFPGSPSPSQEAQARQEVERCISELLILPKTEALFYWNGRLSRAERSILGRFAGAFSPALQQPLSLWSYLDRQYAVFQEPVLQKVVRRDETVAWVSLNSYGCEVLNTQQVLIADIDLPSGTHPACPQHKRKMPAFEEEIFERARDMAKRDLGFRFYRTKAGFRAICITHTFEPESAEAQAVLRGLKSDPLYVALCRSQGCFRARLTPKPWRTNEDGKYRVADYLRTVGRSKVAPEIEALVLLHDIRCGVAEQFELA